MKAKMECLVGHLQQSIHCEIFSESVDFVDRTNHLFVHVWEHFFDL